MIQPISSGGPVVMDLGNFTAETYQLRFSIEGRQYEFSYAEARVDEVFALLAEKRESDPKITMENRRRAVTDFLSHVLMTGDPNQLAEDLKKVPYITTRGSLSMGALYELITSRIKKKDPGEMKNPSR